MASLGGLRAVYFDVEFPLVGDRSLGHCAGAWGGSLGSLGRVLVSKFSDECFHGGSYPVHVHHNLVLSPAWSQPWDGAFFQHARAGNFLIR